MQLIAWMTLLKHDSCILFISDGQNSFPPPLVQNLLFTIFENAREESWNCNGKCLCVQCYAVGTSPTSEYYHFCERMGSGKGFGIGSLGPGPVVVTAGHNLPWWPIPILIHLRVLLIDKFYKK